MREAWVRMPGAEREGSGDGVKIGWMDVDSLGPDFAMIFRAFCFINI